MFGTLDTFLYVGANHYVSDLHKVQTKLLICQSKTLQQRLKLKEMNIQ